MSMGESLGGFRVAAAILLVLGVLCVLVEVQSPSVILWTGRPVTATNDGGIAYYSVDGRDRTVDVPGPPPAQPVPVTVYVDPSDRTRDRVDGPARVFDLVFVLLPFVAAGICLAAGIRRAVRRAARAASTRSTRGRW